MSSSDTVTPAPIQAFADGASSWSTQLDRAADLAVTRASADTSGPMLVLAVRPFARDGRVVASAGNSAIRAAISVAVAAGNLRAWSSLEDGDLAEIDALTLPEIIRSAAIPCGMRTARIATLGSLEEPSLLAIWFHRVATLGDTGRAEAAAIVAELQAAVEADRLAAGAAAPAATEPTAPTKSDAEVLAELPDRARFVEALEEVESEETALVVVGIDDFAMLDDAHGAGTADLMRRTVAARLTQSVRRTDLVAVVDDATFGVLLVDVERSAAFEVTRRLRAQLAEPIETTGGPFEVALSVGLAHDVGLVDAVELFDSAYHAMRDAQNDGGARMLVAC